MDAKDTLFSKKTTINCQGRLIDLTQPKVMAIINTTPDSFYDGGKYQNESDLKKRTENCINEGADILDVGACSSRPGAAHISEKEETERLDKALTVIRKTAPEALISLDTFRSGVAQKMIAHYGINIINDIAGGDKDDKLVDLAAKHKLPYIIMHMQGNPQNMQTNPTYDDVTGEILTYFAFKTDQLLQRGVNDMLIDPGFGFGKELSHNYEIMNNLEDFRTIGCPIMVGISRKSMIYWPLNSTPDHALTGTIAMHMAALMKGADILRAHDVKEAKETITLFSTLKQYNG